MKYKTVVIDPPWPSSFIVLKRRPNQKQMPYKTMTLEEIKNFPINDYADSDCNLFIWTTHTWLKHTFEIIEAWGFKYHCCITWDKTNGLSLFGFTRQTEFVIFAYRGKITVNQKGKFIPTQITESQGKHSQKPQIFYQILLRNTPAPRIDIFSRKKHFGFDSFGNEAENPTTLEAFTD
jgi:N6-adenosine-specific RNA methylase IME4